MTISADPIDTAIDALDKAFGEIAALAAHERKVHPDPRHYVEVDAAIEGLRVELRACRDSARNDRAVGNSTTAMHTLSRARAALSHARGVWEARLAAAEVAAGFERTKARAAAAANLEAIRAGGAVGRKVENFGLRDASRLLRQRLEMLEPAIDADLPDFGDRLRDLDNAAKSFTNAIAVAHRELRMKQAAARADQAVAARLAA